MPKTLHKVQKQIAKQRRKLDSLHENSRDSKRLRRAGEREHKLAVAASVTMKGRQSFVDRVHFFKENIQDPPAVLSDGDMAQLITRFIARHQPELDQLQQERRPGRPPVKREEVLREKIEAEGREFESGFWLPDMGDEENIKKLAKWNGEWSSMKKNLRQPTFDVRCSNLQPPYPQSPSTPRHSNAATPPSLLSTMLSLRAFARSVPRTFSRSIAISARSTISKPSILQSAWIRAPRYVYPATAAFSTTRARLEPAGQSDLELAAKLNEEMKYEQNDSSVETLPESVQYYIDNCPFEIQHKEGEDEVVLTRTFGDEKIRVAFSLSDIQDLTENDSALADEHDDLDAPTNERQGRGSQVPVAPEEKVSEADQEEEGFEDEDQVPSYPARVSVTIEKKGKGAMQIETIAQDGFIQIQNVGYFAKADLANAASAEKEWTRQSLYSGPPFGNLDEDLQTLMERYLEERGIDSALALFVPDYIEFKEQQEYIRWLRNLKTFVEA
ncbi:suaprga1 [Histoplasma capsulatum G186AR]|uniref:Suaprga1 n=2 Tax=Ajellomyces capsulatus TaxID=5037 RepID=C0NZB8_AJECG|nr:suaprga1 [Histoplasma capsulatum G186AR]EEH03166.1 suaprga1 [Histoplasma capsulatum G186AR]